MTTQEHAGRTSGDLVSLGDEQKALELVSSTVFDLWEAVNNLTRLRPTKPGRYRVTIFGSARVPESHWGYAAVRHIAAELTRLDCDIVTGGGPGLMQAANEGARMASPDATTRSVGVRVDLPFEQHVNAFVTELYQHRTFFSRLHHFVLISDAFVVLPGDIGTVLEMMMVWQLLQVRKLHGTPLVLVGNMYAGLIEWFKASMLRPDCDLASPADLDIPVCVPDGDDVPSSILRIIREHHARWLQAQGST